MLIESGSIEFVPLTIVKLLCVAQRDVEKHQGSFRRNRKDPPPVLKHIGHWARQWPNSRRG
jgi:hypothetical protein